jgi:hypothetical protein
MDKATSKLSGLLGTGMLTTPDLVRSRMINPGPLATLLLLVLPGLADAQEKKLALYPAMAPVEQYRSADARDEIALARTPAQPVSRLCYEASMPGAPSRISPITLAEG